MSHLLSYKDIHIRIIAAVKKQINSEFFKKFMNNLLCRPKL
jgi:hypothetical protein